MSISEYIKPFVNYTISMLAEIGQTTILSLYLAIPTAVFSGINTWVSISDNRDFLRIVLTAIAIDHILGTIGHSRFFKNDFSLVKNIGGLAIKLLIVVTMGSLFNDLATLTKTEDFIYKYLSFVTHIIIFLYPARSAMRNCYIITGKTFPPKIMMKNSDSVFESMDITMFNKNKSKEETQDENNDDTNSI